MMAKCLKPHPSKDALSFNIKGEMRGGRQSPTPSPLLSSFRRLHEQRPMVPRRGRGVVSRGNGGGCLRVN